MDIADSESAIGFQTRGRITPETPTRSEDSVKNGPKRFCIDTISTLLRKSGSVNPNLMSDLSPKVELGGLHLMRRH